MELVRHFEDNEKTNEIINLPNALSAARAIGGVATGALMATGTIGAGEAIGIGAILATTDAEGNLIRLTENYASLQDKLRIHASKYGEKLDPIADKALVVSMLIGGVISGDISAVVASGITATEVATSAVTIAAETKGNSPKVSRAGKMGMIARILAVGSNLAASAVPVEKNAPIHNIFTDTTMVAFTSAMALGAISCYKLSKDYLFKSK